MDGGVATLLDRGWDAFESEAWETAEDYGRKALRRDGGSAEARLLVANAIMNQGEYAEAARLLREAVEAEPDNGDCRVDLGTALFQGCEFAGAEEQFRRSLDLRPDSAEARYGLALCLERASQVSDAERLFAEAAEIDPEAFPPPARLGSAEFHAALREAVEQLPGEFHAALQNVLIEVCDLPDGRLLTEYDPPLDPGLLGLFEGVPRPEQSLLDAPRLPERISLFQRNLERQCADREELIDEIVVTLRHEIGHYLGLEEDDLERCGYD